MKCSSNQQERSRGDAQHRKVLNVACNSSLKVTLVQVLPKPDRVAQQFYDGTRRVAFTKNIFAKQKSTEVPRSKNITDKLYIGFIAVMHALCLAAPFVFSWQNLCLFGVTYFVTGCLGITLSFHRQLAHKSFKTPKWLEYVFAYFGALAVQGDPKEWVSTHRCASDQHFGSQATCLLPILCCPGHSSKNVLCAHLHTSGMTASSK